MTNQVTTVNASATMPAQTTLAGVDHLETANHTARKPQMVICHYTAADDRVSRETLTSGGVSAHYLLFADGHLASIGSDETIRTWHAGVGSWRGLTDINSLSIGIEIVNWGFKGSHVPATAGIVEGLAVEGSSHQWTPYPDAQIEVLAALLKDIKSRWKIQDQFFLGHSDVSPGRKVDPGPLFPWERLHREHGIGAWPDLEKPLRAVELPAEGRKVLWTQRHLRDYGYACPVTGEWDDPSRLSLQAFQMHFRPANISGSIDDESIRLLAALVDQYVYAAPKGS